VFWLRSFKLALLVFVPMGLGLLFSTALTALFIDHLTMLASGFTAILFGMGVDYGIFMSTRIIEELAAGRTLVDGTTLAGLGAIVLARYQGISLLGSTITIGLCRCLVAVLFVAPSLTQVLFRRKDAQE